MSTPGRVWLIIGLSLSLLLGCGKTPDPAQQAEQLLSSAETGDILTLQRLLGSQVSANVRNSCDWTPLMKAAVNGHRPAVEQLLAAGADIDATDQGGYTALLLAASNNHAEIVQQLLAHGAMIDAQEQTQGYTALIWAAHRGHLDTVELLLAQGSDATLPDFAGRTAADHARDQHHPEILTLLTSPEAAPRHAAVGNG